MASRLFKKGAWLVRNERELTEDEFIKAAGGRDKIIAVGCPFVILILDGDDKGRLLGSDRGDTIKLKMSGFSTRWQCMEMR
jgi:hypothetical protein